MITLFLLHPIKQIPVQVWSFENESVIRIGRSTDNHVILYSAVVSRHHVELRRTGDSWEIVNMGTNGTYLDGKRINQVPAVDGSVIRLARSGPNIQIRLGNVSMMPDTTMIDDRLVPPPPDMQSSDTEIHEHKTRIRGEDSSDEIGDDQPLTIEGASDSNNQIGTIPVPPHLQISQETQSRKVSPQSAGRHLASTIAVSRILNRLSSMPLSNPSTCTHANAKGKLFCPDCGQPVNVLHSVGDYQIVQVLGQGIIGITYLAWCQGQTLVLKTLNRDWLDNEKAHAALEHEAEMLQQINHPRIPHVVDFFSVSEHPYLVLELIRGLHLSQLVSSQGTFSLEQAIASIIEICEILDYLHNFTPPLLHRGIRPHSIIAPDDSTVAKTSKKMALVDFGAVKNAALEQDIPAGLTAYAAPEQLSVEATPAADLYGLGPVFAYLVTGQNPVAFYADREDGYRFYADSIPNLPSDVRDIMHRLTQPDPNQRYDSARSLLEDLQALPVTV